MKKKRKKIRPKKYTYWTYSDDVPITKSTVKDICLDLSTWDDCLEHTLYFLTQQEEYGFKLITTTKRFFKITVEVINNPKYDPKINRKCQKKFNQERDHIENELKKFEDIENGKCPVFEASAKGKQLLDQIDAHISKNGVRVR